MSRFPVSARLAALPLAAVLAAGLWAPAQAAPDPNPPTGYDRADRARRPHNDLLRGTIVRVFSARTFDLRNREGRTYRVNLPFSVGLQSGLGVRVRGDLQGSTFEARVLSLGDFDDRDEYGDNNGPGYGNGSDPGYGTGNGSGYGRSVVLTGRVTRLYSRTEFDVRDDDDGTIYRVSTRDALDSSVRVGDRIQARGDLNGSSIRADYASEIGGTGGNTGGDDRFGKAVDFPATLQSVLLNLGEATVRADNGSYYRVKADRNRLDDFRLGQRVRVRGTYRDGVVVADAITGIY